MATVTATGEDAVKRKLDDDDVDCAPPADLEHGYDIQATVEWIASNEYEVVGLQFPDGLLPHSIPVLRLLRRSLALVGRNAELYIMADTTYGSCCVDEVAAQHVSADAVVHYGHACMSSNSRIPTLYVLPKAPFALQNLGSLAEAIANVDGLLTANLCELVYDVAYDWIIDEIFHALQTRTGNRLFMHRLSRSVQPAAEKRPSAPDSNAILYLGPESRRLTNVLLVNSRVPVWAIDPCVRPFAARLQTAASNRLLGRRYGALQRARDADTIGLAVGTLGVSGYLPLLRQLRQTVAHHRRKCYTVAVGKLRPEKLANLTEVQAWVLVACPENSLLDGLDAKEYPVPIITPFELRVALASADEDAGEAATKWDGTYITDFAALLGPLQGERAATQAPGPLGSWENVPVFSSSTGKLRGRRVWVAQADQPEADDDLSPATRTAANALTSARDSPAGAFFANRTFRGLEQGPPVGAAQVETGRSGIARGYANEATS